MNSRTEVKGSFFALIILCIIFYTHIVASKPTGLFWHIADIHLDPDYVLVSINAKNIIKKLLNKDIY